MAKAPPLASSSSISIEGTQNRQKSPNKRPASTSLSESETLVALSNLKDNFTSELDTQSMKAKTLSGEAHRRKRRRKKLSVTKKGGRAPNPTIMRLTDASSSKDSLKGKEKEVSTDETFEDERDKELALLREQVQRQTTALNSHKEFFEIISPSITCQICLEPMYRPYTLAPCGHTACYGCLLSWFRAVPQAIPQPPPPELEGNFDPDEPQLLARGAPLLIIKKKNCPHCRAEIREAPIESWGIKDIVAHLVASKSDITDQVFPTLERREETSAREPTGADAWKGVFTRDDTQTRILPVPNGQETAATHTDYEERGFFDEEDQVYRCTTCFNEIWDGTCSGCGRGFRGHRSTDDDSYDSDDMEDRPGITWMDAEDFHIPGQDQAIPAHFAFGQNFWFSHSNAVFGHEDGDEDEYESSFIDDEDNGEEYHSAADVDEHGGEGIEHDEFEGRSRAQRLFGSSPRAVRSGNIERSWSNVNSSDVADAGSNPGSPVTELLHSRRNILRILGSEDDDDDEYLPNVGPRRRRFYGRRTIQPHHVVDSTESEGNDDRPVDGGSRLNSNESDDDDDEEDETHLNGLLYLTRPRRNRSRSSIFTREESLSDEEDYSGDDHHSIFERATLGTRGQGDHSDDDDDTHGTVYSAGYYSDEADHQRWSDGDY